MRPPVYASGRVCMCWLILDLLFSHTYITHINRFARWRCSLFAYLLLISWKIGLVVQFSVFSLSFVLVHTLCSLSWFSRKFSLLCVVFRFCFGSYLVITTNVKLCFGFFNQLFVLFFVCGFHRKERIGKKTQNCKINKKPIFLSVFDDGKKIARMNLILILIWFCVFGKFTNFFCLFCLLTLCVVAKKTRKM